MHNTEYIHDKRIAIGQSIRKKRKEASMTQKDLADRVGTIQMNISDIEKGKINYGVDKLISICELLDIKLF